MKSRVALAIIFCGLWAIGVIASHDPLVLSAACGTIFFGTYLLWPSDRPPLLCFPFLLQAISVLVKPIQAALVGVSLNDLAQYGNVDLAPAVYFGSAALLSFAFGLKFGTKTETADSVLIFSLDAARWTKQIVLRLSLAFIVGGHLSGLLSQSLGGELGQSLNMLSSMSISGMFLLTYWCLQENRALQILGAVIAFEVIVGMTGFFAEFKGILLAAILGALGAKPRISISTLTLGILLVSIVLSITIFWSTIKSNYRDFLNEGQKSQVVTVSTISRLVFLSQQMQNLSQEDIKRGIDALASRASYIDYLAHTIQNVPEVLPHAGGEQTLAALIHVLMPRIFFPNKPPAPNDTLTTATYTMLDFDTSGYTSVSIGYVGELYIDFGIFGALIAMACLGFLLGKFYEAIISYKQTPPLINAGLALTALLQVSLFERALLKFAGAGFAAFIMYYLFQRYFMRRILHVFAGTLLDEWPRGIRNVGQPQLF